MSKKKKLNTNSSISFFIFLAILITFVELILVDPAFTWCLLTN